MNTINHQFAWKWILCIGIAWVVGRGLAVNAAGFGGILFWGFAIAIAQRLALDLEQDWRYVGGITICWTISFIAAAFVTYPSLSVRGQLGGEILFGVLGGSISSTITALHLLKDVEKKTMRTISFALTGLIAGGVSMGLCWYLTDVATASKELWFLKVLAGIMISGMVYGLITLISVHSLPFVTSRRESA